MTALLFHRDRKGCKMTKPKKEEAGPAELAEKPKRHRLMIQFEACVIEFNAAKDSNDRQTELLALGGARQIYWLLLAAGNTDYAKDIAAWWKDAAPKHNLSKDI